MGELIIIGKSSTVMIGDSVKGGFRVTWRKDNAKDIAIAEKTFKEYIRKGWLAIGEVSGKKKQIFAFNPDLEKIVLSPFMIGG